MTKNQFALRGYVHNLRKYVKSVNRSNASNSLVLVFDTETTTDEYQNLKFGSCGVWENDQMKLHIFYESETITDKELGILKAYALKHDIKLMSRSEFIETVFLPYVYNGKAVCVGFNLPFDLSRLAEHFGEARTMGYENGFSLQLSHLPWNPRLVVKSLDSKRCFIKFAKRMRNRKDHRLGDAEYRGCFLDLRTFLFALTNKPYNLKSALVDFQCERRKIDVESHGKITEEYIDYNINDTLATHELYQKALERYRKFCLDNEPHRLYSPAGIGRGIEDKIGILPFDKKNPGFPPELIGLLMTTYHGGRVEVRIRKMPIRVTYLDFTSMYPSVYVLLSLDKILKAEKVTYSDTTKETQDLLNRITLEDLRNKRIWPQFNSICRIKPNEDILPVRSRYDDKHVYNIGVNYVTSSVSLWYALPDLIASKLLTGKTPIIEEAISFKPEGVQEDLREIEVLKGIPLKPEEDVFKKLIEERLRLKKMRDETSGEERVQLSLQVDILKIIANSASYGIYVQIDPSEEKQEKVDVYGLKHITAHDVKTETPGPAFNPIMATMITSGAKLILAMAEKLVLDTGGYIAYCDTDSIFVNPENEQTVQDFFKPLNPYNTELDMFKVEEDEDGNHLRNVWFYGISAKRYCLYELEKERLIRKYSSHGLGENLMGLDHEQFWKDILKIHYNPESRDKVLAKYENKYAIYNFRVSSHNVYKRFKTLNDSKDLSKQIKPFNFITMGRGYQKNTRTNEPIIPILPFINEKDKRFRTIPYMPFIDYKTGDSYPNENSLETQYYWKPLVELLEDYIDHKESKSEGDIGVLNRKHLVINESSICYIGKESNQLEKSQITGVEGDNYTIYEDTQAIKNRDNDRILNMSESEALELGIKPRRLQRTKKNIRKTGNVGRSRIKELLKK